MVTWRDLGRGCKADYASKMDKCNRTLLSKQIGSLMALPESSPEKREMQKIIGKSKYANTGRFMIGKNYFV